MGEEISIEQRVDSVVNSKRESSELWLNPQIAACADNTIRIPYLSSNSVTIRKDDHLLQIVRTVTVNQPKEAIDNITSSTKKHPSTIQDNQQAFKDVVIDRDNTTPPEFREKFESLCDSYSHVFSPKIKGYNSRDGAVKAIVNPTAKR